MTHRVLAKTNELDAALYPDVVRAGGFPSLVENTRNSIGSELAVETMALPFFYVLLRLGDRQCQLKVDVDEAVRLTVATRIESPFLNEVLIKR